MVVSSMESGKEKEAHWIQSETLNPEINTTELLRVSRPTFVLKHEACESQHCASDHGDGARESCIHHH